VEACLSEGAEAALLYPENLPAGFFDLSTAQAGALLQQLRNYRLRLAVVCPPGAVEPSRRFGDMVREERRTGYFDLFESRAEALAWLESSAAS
jgi:hypothetical protein